jgi:hypothetical protein
LRWALADLLQTLKIQALRLQVSAGTLAGIKRELTENLLDLLKDIKSRQVPYIRKVEELEVA